MVRWPMRPAAAGCGPQAGLNHASLRLAVKGQERGQLIQACSGRLGSDKLSPHTISSKEAQHGKSLAELAAQNIDDNTKASNGRIVSRDLGRQTLGAQEAWGVQRYFDSAAGRTDSVMYIVLTEGFEYRVSCGTKQGPPVIPWENVAPVCERVLETIEFKPWLDDRLTSLERRWVLMAPPGVLQSSITFAECDTVMLAVSGHNARPSQSGPLLSEVIVVSEL